MTAGDAASSRYAAVIALVAVALLGLFAVWQRCRSAGSPS